MLDGGGFPHARTPSNHTPPSVDGTRRVVPRVGVVLLGVYLRWYGPLVKTYPPLYGGRVTLPPRGGRHLGAELGWVPVVLFGILYILHMSTHFAFGVAVKQPIKR